MNSLAAVCVGLMSVMCFNSNASNITHATCTDPGSTKQVQIVIDKSTPDYITVDDTEYAFADSITEGDVQQLWYSSHDNGVVKLSFVLDQYPVKVFKIKTNSIQNFSTGECK